jgi:hypothetical protein
MQYVRCDRLNYTPFKSTGAPTCKKVKPSYLAILLGLWMDVTRSQSNINAVVSSKKLNQPRERLVLSLDCHGHHAVHSDIEEIAALIPRVGLPRRSGKLLACPRLFW